MKKIFGSITALLLAGYIVVNLYTENNTKREEERIKIEREEKNKQKIKTSIQELATKYNAVTDWDAKLSNGNSYRIEPILTVELEKLWIADRPILFNGTILDIKTKNEDNYTIIIERDVLSNINNLFSTNLQLSFVAKKCQIDTFLKMHPNLFKGLGFGNSVAVVAKIHAIETIYISGEECDREIIKIGHGEMLDLRFVGQVSL